MLGLPLLWVCIFLLGLTVSHCPKMNKSVLKEVRSDSEKALKAAAWLGLTSLPTSACWPHPYCQISLLKYEASGILNLELDSSDQHVLN